MPFATAISNETPDMYRRQSGGVLQDPARGAAVQLRRKSNGALRWPEHVGRRNSGTKDQLCWAVTNGGSEYGAGVGAAVRQAR
jgi:hypothetical protein